MLRVQAFKYLGRRMRSSLSSRDATRAVFIHRNSSSFSLQNKQQWVKIDYKGTVVTVENHLSVLKTSLNLHSRDLLALAIPNPGDNTALTQTRRLPYIILPRQTCILASLGNVKAIIQRRRVILFDPTAPHVQSLVTEISRNMPLHKTAFELHVLETLLTACCDSFDRRIRICNTILDHLIEDADSGNIDPVDMIYRLPPLLDLFYDFELELQEAHRSVLDMLNNDEDMAMMQLTHRAELMDSQEALDSAAMPKDGSGGRRAMSPHRDIDEYDVPTEHSATPRDKYTSRKIPSVAGVGSRDSIGDEGGAVVDGPTINSSYISSGRGGKSLARPVSEDHEEAELLLESFALRLSQSLSSMLFLEQKVKSQRGLTDLSMQLNRNRLLSLNVNLAAGAVCISLCSAVTSAFGMNLTHGLEEYKDAFLVVCACSGMGASLVWYLIWIYKRGDVFRSIEERHVLDRKWLADIDIRAVELAVGAACRILEAPMRERQLLERALRYGKTTAGGGVVGAGGGNADSAGTRTSRTRRPSSVFDSNIDNYSAEEGGDDGLGAVSVSASATKGPTAATSTSTSSTPSPPPSSSPSSSGSYRIPRDSLSQSDSFWDAEQHRIALEKMEQEQRDKLERLEGATVSKEEFAKILARLKRVPEVDAKEVEMFFKLLDPDDDGVMKVTELDRVQDNLKLSSTGRNFGETFTERWKKKQKKW